MLLLGGCQSSLVGTVDDYAAPAAGAAPLDMKAYTNAPNDRTGVIDAINTSELNCVRYKRSLIVVQKSSNGFFDVLTTLLAGLATAFTPIATVHALTAGATISSGAKGAIDTNFYQGETVSFVIAAIQKTYDVQMVKLLATVDSEKGTTVNESIADVQRINTLCSLSEALASASGTTPAAPVAAPTAADIVAGAKFTTPGGIIFTVTTLTGTTASYSETVAGQTLKGQTTTAQLLQLLLSQQATKS